MAYSVVRTHVAFIRGINVGGHNQVAMADLREIVTSLGNSDVATYIQSGNVVFTSVETDASKLASALERSMAERLGFAPSVVVLSGAELAQVIADNPFPDEPNPKCLHAVFRSDEIGAHGLAVLGAAQQRARDKGSRDTARVVGRTIFLYTPDGLGRSELAAQVARIGSGTSGAAGTARNWATVTKLMSLLSS